VVGIAVVSYDDYLIVGCLGSFHGVFHTSVNRLHCLLYGRIHSCVTHHVAIGIVNHDEVIFFFLYCSHELVGLSKEELEEHYYKEDPELRAVLDEVI